MILCLAVREYWLELFSSQNLCFYLSIIVLLSDLYVPYIFSGFGGHFLLDVDVRTKVRTLIWLYF